MLDDRYFKALGEPASARLRSLPQWAHWYVVAMKREASWWHSIQPSRGRPPRPVTRHPLQDRVNKLPQWAIEWINTLRFEIDWQRDKAFERQPPLPERGASLSRGRSLLGMEA